MHLIHRKESSKENQNQKIIEFQTQNAQKHPALQNAESVVQRMGDFRRMILTRNGKRTTAAPSTHSGQETVAEWMLNHSKMLLR